MENKILAETCLDCPLRAVLYRNGKRHDICNHPDYGGTVCPSFKHIPFTCPLIKKELILGLQKGYKTK